MRGGVREADRKETRVAVDCAVVERDDEEEAMAAEKVGRRRISFTESVQTLRASSL